VLLNVCFDRPLAIVRSEKTFAAEGGRPSSSLAHYGLNEWTSPQRLRKLEVARHDIELRKKTLESKVQEEKRARKVLQSKADGAAGNEYRAAARATREAAEGARAELDEARGAYTRDMALAGTQPLADRAMPQPMTVSALELQYQGEKLHFVSHLFDQRMLPRAQKKSDYLSLVENAGLRIVRLLSKMDAQYFESQNDVVRALRWLWRSRGRHYRLLHEEELPPRYHRESPDLGGFLVDYSRANPADADVLFDLIRIFLQPLSSVDFSFVQEFLLETVSSVFSVEQKALVLSR